MVKFINWRDRDGQEKRRTCARQIHLGVQAGGCAAGLWSPGGDGDGEDSGGTSTDAWQLGPAQREGFAQGAGDKPVSAEQMELVRLRAELARVKMERDI